MDRNTLESLKVAFAAAPSESLAVVIMEAILKDELVDELFPYIRVITSELSDEKAVSLLVGLNGKRDKNLLSSLVKQLDSKVVDVLPEIATQDKAACSNIYQCYVDCFPSQKNTVTNPVSETGLAEEPQKLRVVEKVNLDKVTNLNRYRESVTTFDDVVGLEDIKKQIHKKIILPFQKPSVFQKFKKKVGGGVLLFGPPGCGKTLIARATAGECNAQFFNIEISDVLDMYIGESEQKLHSLFEKARDQTPSVLFFDEMEALAGKREHSRNASSANVVSQFLTELDGFSQNNEGVLVLASTNVPWAIDPAFLRPGRFDRMFFVAPPDKVARQAILKHHMKDRPSTKDIDFSALAHKTSGYSGADLANLVEAAADEAIDETIESGSEVSISAKHFLGALSFTRQTTSEWLTTARNYARYANDGGRYDDVLAFLKKHGR